jgi:cyclohexadienyl dehydratase
MRHFSKRMIRGCALAACVYLACGSSVWAGAVADRVRSSGVVKVCIWPDYYGITHRNPNTQKLSGIDIDLSGALGLDLKTRVEYVDSSFPTLVNDLLRDRCDVAMFAVGILPQRTEQLKFSQPYLQSDIYAVSTQSSRTVRQWSDIDKPGVLVGVQAGTFMEPVMQQSLKAAQLVSIAPPATRERELEAGRVDVFMTDYAYSRRLLDNADWARLIAPPKPFYVLPYGYAVKPGDAAWLAQLNTFVSRIKHDGRLDAAAARHGLSPIVVHD